jgi:hypothetical protein
MGWAGMAADFFLKKNPNYLWRDIGLKRRNRCLLRWDGPEKILKKKKKLSIYGNPR